MYHIAGSLSTPIGSNEKRWAPKSPTADPQLGLIGSSKGQVKGLAADVLIARAYSLQPGSRGTRRWSRLDKTIFVLREKLR